METKSKRMKAEISHPRSKRRKRPRQEEYVSYLLGLDKWDYSLSFRSSDPKLKRTTTAYEWLTTLCLTGDLIKPENSKFETAEVTLCAISGMLDEPLADEERRIGTVSVINGELLAYVFLAEERFGELLTAVQSGQIKIVNFVAAKLRYRRAPILGVYLSTRFDEEDW